MDDTAASVLHYLKGSEGTGAALPLEAAVYSPVHLWPDYAFDVREACGIRWNWADIRRFLDKTERVGKCLMWKGAKSRGQGNTQWYGSFHTQGKTVRAHKFYGVAVLGLRPQPGEELDHECNDSLCVRVRILSRPENQARIRRPTARVLEPGPLLRNVGGRSHEDSAEQAPDYHHQGRGRSRPEHRSGVRGGASVRRHYPQRTRAAVWAPGCRGGGVMDDPLPGEDAPPLNTFDKEGWREVMKHALGSGYSDEAFDVAWEQFCAIKAKRNMQ